MEAKRHALTVCNSLKQSDIVMGTCAADKGHDEDTDARKAGCCVQNSTAQVGCASIVCSAKGEDAELVGPVD
jgi:hypothetical protein